MLPRRLTRRTGKKSPPLGGGTPFRQNPFSGASSAVYLKKKQKY
jgi:hypothetical protein